MATHCLTVAPVATKPRDIGELPLAYDRLYLELNDREFSNELHTRNNK
jgi:hypothetical protein